MAEQERRNKAVRESNDAAREKAAVVFMTQWMKRRDVLKEKVLALTDWSEAEIKEIARVYRYHFS